MKWQVYFSNTE